jgi:hypothetical protein
MARRKSVSKLLALTMLSGALFLAIAATQAQAALRHIDGTVVSKNANARTFKVTTQGGSRLTIKVNGNTVFQRIAGKFSGLRAGMAIEVEAQSTSTGLLAKHVEPKESGGGGGGGGGGGADDPPNHG